MGLKPPAVASKGKDRLLKPRASATAQDETILIFTAGDPPKAGAWVWTGATLSALADWQGSRSEFRNSY
jgi:hypothetical protein